ncbi:hypothetical protein MLD38_037777 [Melastoma candidum]|uniref:Uncharacterized protein n=1 Tax=Melastoma candidum TaxID=119954 RepID=A0ACB9LQC4_9MYRT|nr:hypothetical protein MLD38_037777 [Melastoma candidum]
MRYGKLIIKEGCIGPLLLLLKEGTFSKAQENVTLAISLLSRDSESVEEIIRVGVPAVLTKARMKAMAARVLWHLTNGNSLTCRSITESRALLCFALLLEKGSEEVRYNSAVALMEITTVAEKDANLRRSAFKPNSPACKAIVGQLLMIINKADSELLVPCVKAVGNLARTFKATETIKIKSFRDYYFTK